VIRRDDHRRRGAECNDAHEDCRMRRLSGEQQSAGEGRHEEHRRAQRQRADALRHVRADIRHRPRNLVRHVAAPHLGLDLEVQHWRAQ
jgi:hypothetical protein